MEKTRVNAGTEAGRLAGFILHALERDDTVEVSAVNERSIAKAVFAIAIASAKSEMPLPVTMRAAKLEHNEKALHVVFTVNR